MEQTKTKKDVLVISNDDIFRIQFQRCLEMKSEYVVTTFAEGGEAAFDLATREKPYQMIFLHWNHSGGLDGPDTLSAIRECWAQTPVIVFVEDAKQSATVKTHSPDCIMELADVPHRLGFNIKKVLGEVPKRDELVVQT